METFLDYNFFGGVCLWCWCCFLWLSSLMGPVVDGFTATLRVGSLLVRSWSLSCFMAGQDKTIKRCMEWGANEHLALDFIAFCPFSCCLQAIRSSSWAKSSGRRMVMRGMGMIMVCLLNQNCVHKSKLIFFNR